MAQNSPLVPTFHGYVLSNEDALIVIQAALNNKHPLVKRRPLDSERPELIRSGNVFVFIEESSDIKRWTDGISWSASRILGRFLVYRRLDRSNIQSRDDKRKGRGSFGKRKGSVDSQTFTEIDSRHGRSSYSSASSTDLISHYESVDPHCTEAYASSPVSSYGKYSSSRDVSPARPCSVAQDKGLIKKTLSLKIPASDTEAENTTHTVHLISYFCAHDVLAGNLIRPSQTNLKDIPIKSSLWQAIKRSSLGGKLMSDGEANYYLDSNYQLQNMTSLSAHEERVSNFQQEAQPQFYRDSTRRYSSVYPSYDSSMSVYMSSAASGAPMGAPGPGTCVPVSAPASCAPIIPLRAPMGAPIRSRSMASVGNEHHFFPNNTSGPFMQAHGGHEFPTSRKYSDNSNPKKRSKSLQTGHLAPRHSSVDNLYSDNQVQYSPRQLDVTQSSVTSLLKYPNFGGNIVKSEIPSVATLSGFNSLDHPSYAHDPARGIGNGGLQPAVVNSAEGGYEQYYAPATPNSLNNSAFGLQMSQQTFKKPFSFNSSSSFSPQLRWDSIPMSTPPISAGERLDAHNEEIEYDPHEVYD